MDYEYKQDQSNLALKDQLYAYRRYWKLFLVTGIVCFAIALLYLKYTPVEYKVAATILIKEDKGSILSELSAFEDLSIVENSNKEVENEIEILKSRPLIENVVSALHLQYQYFSKTKYSKRLVELYKNRPFSVQFFPDSTHVATTFNFDVVINTDDTFTISEDAIDLVESGNFEQSLALPVGMITLLKNPVNFQSFIEEEVYLQIQPLSDAVEDLKSKISVGRVNKDASVISLSMHTSTKDKAKDILNHLIAEYNNDAIRDKNLVYENTAKFIKERLLIINTELSDIEQGVEVFKTSNNLTNVTSEAELFLENASENKKEILETTTQQGLVTFMEEYLQNNETGLLPANLGFSDEGIVRMIEHYNTLYLKRDEILKGTTLKNPIVLSLDEQIGSVRQSLAQSLKNQKSSLAIKLRGLNRQDAKMNAKIASLPKQERQLRDIVRQQEIKETLYLYLLQKREETAISLAATVANAKTIENAYSSKWPVKPKKRIVFLAAFLATFLIPAGSIFIKDLLDIKVKDRKEIQHILDIPVVAEIPGMDVKSAYVLAKNDRSVVAESFRIFESNLKFLLPNEKNKGDAILITSSITGEGKTFISTNLAITLSDPDKKVALLGLDLRSPKILEYLNTNGSIGISNYIRDENLSINDIVTVHEDIPNLHIIPSGIIPPNPNELLKSKRFMDLMEELKSQYDYLIIDTPPIGMVADSLLVSNFVDLCVYVVRSNFTDKRLLSIPENLYKDRRFSKMVVLLNGVDNKDKGYYGYGYGYGYGNSTSKRWWDFLKKK